MRANSFDFASFSATTRNSLLDKVPFGCIDLSSTTNSNNKKGTATPTNSSSSKITTNVPTSLPRNNSGIIDASSFQERESDETRSDSEATTTTLSGIPTTRSAPSWQEKEEAGGSPIDSPAPLEFLDHGEELSFDPIEGESPPQANTSTTSSSASDSSSSLGPFTNSCNSYYDPSASITDLLQPHNSKKKKKNVFQVSVTFKGLSAAATNTAASSKKVAEVSVQASSCPTAQSVTTITPREDIDTHFQASHLQLEKQQHCEQWAKKQEAPREEFCLSERCQKFAVLSFLRSAVNYHKSRVTTPDDEFRLFRLQLLIRRVVEERLRPNWSDPLRCWRIVQELNLFQTKVLEAVDDLLFELNY